MARRLRPLASSVHVIADRPDRYLDLGLPTLGDLEPRLGPLGGVATALRHSESDWLWICSCDLLDLRPLWLERLEAARDEAPDRVRNEARDEHPRADAGAIVAFYEPAAGRGRDAGRWHPFPALYRRSIEDEVRRRIAEGELRMQRLLGSLARPVPLPEEWPSPAQANSPADLERFRAR